MAATDYQGSFASIRHSILSFRRDPVHPMDAHNEKQELASFQRQVSDLFHDLSATGDGGDDFFTLDWIRKLLDSFLICQEEFRIVLFEHKGVLARPPLDRLMSDFAERAVKALDVCNAVRDGIEQVRQWEKHLAILLAALDPRQKSFGEGQIRRARKALANLTVMMLDDKGAGSVLTHRNRSFGRIGQSSSKDRHLPGSHLRSLSWSVSGSWSASRQLQAIGNNLAAPRGHEIAATNGLASPVFTMSSVLLFVMSALVAAIPCQDRGLHTHFSVPRSFQWAAPILSLHERIMEESKRKDRRNSSGLLKEIHQIEKCAHRLMELTDTIQFPLAGEREMEVRRVVQELSEVSDALKYGLDPLERQLREVFHRTMRCITKDRDS